MEISKKQSNHLKAIAILMMLCLHLFNRDYNGLFSPLIFIGEKPLSFYISLFCDACVPIFAFVSGYGLYIKFEKDKVSFIKSNLIRIKKLYINLWLIIIIFPLGFGLLFNTPDIPGSVLTFLLNSSGFYTSYNPSWWFLTTYILFVVSSSFWFSVFNRIHKFFFFIILLILYIVSFYLRNYKTLDFELPFINWFLRQVILFFCTLFQFMLGPYLYKFYMKSYLNNYLHTLKYKGILFLIGILLLIFLHALIPNFFIAPFTGIVFIILFIQLKLHKNIVLFLDFMSKHSTNIWLTHMFFYLIFFSTFIYSFRFPILIFFALVTLCILSSYFINFFYNRLVN